MKPRDVVILKSGGPTMTVTDVFPVYTGSYVGKKCLCQYWDGSQFIMFGGPIEALRLVD